MGSGASSGDSSKQSTQKGEKNPSQRLIKGVSYKESGRYHQLPRRIQDDFEIQYNKVLGSGMNGSVYLAKAKNSTAQYAVKGFKLHGISKDAKEDLVSEAEIFLKMDHPHVARLIAVYESDQMLHLVMECMEGGELFDRIEKSKRFTEANAAHSVWQMLLAVHYLHSREVCHRDLKLENFLYELKSNDHLKLIDFGFSHVWKPDTMMAASCGTLSYVAPEVLAQSYTKQCDLWSLGVISFILTMGYMPFSGSEDTQVASIMAGNYKKKGQKWDALSESCTQFLEGLLQTDPEKRLTSEAALKHDWIALRDQTGRYHITPLAQLASDDALTSGGGLNIDADTFGALVEFYQASRFRRACMSMMAWSLNQSERAAVRDAFIELDVKRQGTIKISELKEVLLPKLDSKGEKQLNELLSSLSEAQTEEIQYSDFLAAMISRKVVVNEEHLSATFRQFDSGNTGFISYNNLKDVLGNEFQESELKELMLHVDPENKDKISYKNFAQYLQSGQNVHKDSHKSLRSPAGSQDGSSSAKSDNEAKGEDDDSDENDAPTRFVTRKIDVSKNKDKSEPLPGGPGGPLPEVSEEGNDDKQKSKACTIL